MRMRLAAYRSEIARLHMQSDGLCVVVIRVMDQPWYGHQGSPPLLTRHYVQSWLETRTNPTSFRSVGRFQNGINVVPAKYSGRLALANHTRTRSSMPDHDCAYCLLNFQTVRPEEPTAGTSHALEISGCRSNFFFVITGKVNKCMFLIRHSIKYNMQVTTITLANCEPHDALRL